MHHPNPGKVQRAKRLPQLIVCAQPVQRKPRRGTHVACVAILGLRDLSSVPMQVVHPQLRALADVVQHRARELLRLGRSALPGLKLHQFELQRVAARIEDQRKRHTFVRCGHRLPWPGVSAQFHT
jgi:hypothetical protein